MLILGVIDVCYLMFDTQAINKASYVGARYAIVSDPVANDVRSITYTATQSQNLGLPCYDSSGNLDTNRCTPALSTTCDGSTSTCTNGYLFNSSAFTSILRQMQAMYCPAESAPYTGCGIQAANVKVSYDPTVLGFAGRPGGFPMTVTVSLHCVPHPFFFIGAWIQWSSWSDPSCSGPVVPPASTTLLSECLSRHLNSAGECAAEP